MPLRRHRVGQVGLVVLLAGGSASLTAGCASDADRIRDVLDAQVAAWNRGDIDAFMEGYWKSDELVFKSGADEQRGWQATLDRYRRAYDTREKMGTLSFSELRIGPDAVVTGRWHLRRAAGDVGGGFTLLFREFPEGWRIVRDETTVQ